MAAAVPVGILAGAGVNMTLLALALVALIGGVTGLLLWYRSTEKRKTLGSGLPQRGQRLPGPTRDSSQIPIGGDGKSLRRGYDEACARGDFATAARYATKMRDPRRYAEAVTRSGDTERAVQAWVDLGDFHRAARLLLEAGNPGKAAQLYVQGGADRKAADCFLQADQPEQAARLLRQLGDEQRANKLDGDARAQKGQHIEAARYYVAASEMTRAAEQLIKAGDLPKAVEALRRGGKSDHAARLFSEQGEYEPAAKLYVEAKKYAEAAACYEKLGQLDNQARCLAKAGEGYQAGRIAFERGDMDHALTYLEALGPIDERYADAGLFRGQIYERKGEIQAAADAYSVFLKDRAPDSRSKVLFLHVARLHEGIGKSRAARSILGRVITAGLGTADVTAWAARLERAAADEVQTEALEKGGRGGLQKRAERGARNEPLPTEDRKVAAGTRAAAGPGVEAAAGSSSPLPSMDAPDPPAIQSLERRYEFKGQMGQGGNGVVYRAQDRALGRDVVVKFLHQALLPTEVARKYFQREAKTAASLNHPNIVTIFDIGQEGDTPYFSMEMVEGDTLADLIVENRGTLPHEQIVPFCQQLSAALDYAHERQVIHRDIKPGNVMVTRDGIVKLLDFGLAKALDENPDKSVFLCGTPFYMSPEQIRRDFLDHRTDIYSLGCLLYVMYTGDVPFPEGNVFYHHQHTAAPDPADRAPHPLPPGVSEVLLKAVSKDREGRYQRAGDVAKALAACH